MSTIDLRLAPFQDSLPDAVRAIVDLAQVGEGPAVEWLNGDSNQRIGQCYAFLSGKPTNKLEDEAAGWLVGITMFEDVGQRLASVLKRRSYRDSVLPYVIEAFVAGTLGGALPDGRHWKSIEQLLTRFPVIRFEHHDFLPPPKD